MGREDDAASPAGGRGREDTLQPGQILGGRYEITGYIGAGGMGAVYAAKHARTGRELAVKVLLPELATRPALMQRFMAEARAAGGLNHPGIVEVVDLDHDRHLHYIVMERLEGEELQARMRRERPLDPAFAARVGADIADAISCAHNHTPKIIHRDLKPQNVFLARKGPQRDVVKILDFGIAKLVEAETLEHSLTRSGEIYGTPLYMSPEQLRNPKEVDERADIYAIGVILFHALTGTPPFQGESFPDLVIAIGTNNHPPLLSVRPEVPAGLAAVVEKAMAHDRNDRYSFAGQLRDALLPFAAPGSAGDSDRVAPTRPLPVRDSRRLQRGGEVASGKRSRGGLRLMLGVAVLSLGVLGATYALRQQRRVPTPAAMPAETAAEGPASTATMAPLEQRPAAAPDAAAGPLAAPPTTERPEASPSRSGTRRTRKPARKPEAELPPLRPR